MMTPKLGEKILNVDFSCIETLPGDRYGLNCIVPRDALALYEFIFNNKPDLESRGDSDLILALDFVTNLIENVTGLDRDAIIGFLKFEMGMERDFRECIIALCDFTLRISLRCTAVVTNQTNRSWQNSSDKQLFLSNMPERRRFTVVKSKEGGIDETAKKH